MSSENVLTPYEKVLAARKSDRPDIMKYIEVLFDDFIEMMVTDTIKMIKALLQELLHLMEKR